MTEIAFPIKGWNTNQAQNSRPDGTSPDLLNVVPFDRDYILRGAVRKGITKYSSIQMGDGTGTQPVLLLMQVSRALDPSTVQPANLLAEELFDYSDGLLSTVSSGRWTVGTDYFSLTSGSDTTMQIVSQELKRNAAGDANAHFVPSLVLGSSYVIQAVCHVNDPSSTWGLNLGFRFNPSNLGSGLLLALQGSGSNADMRLFTSGAATLSSNISISGIVNSSNDFTLEVHINGNTIAGYLNGVQYVSASNVATNSAFSALGFMMRGPALSSKIVTVKSWKVYSSAPLAAYRETDVVAVCGGNIYVSASGGPFTIASGGSGALSQSIRPQAAQFAGVCYFVDTISKCKTLDLASQTVADIVVSTGSETATTLGEYSLACAWNGRLVLAASVGFPMNFIMSRQNDPTDWDYAQTDVGAAVAGNASKAGAIGDPLNALMPWTDDVLILGGDHTINMVQGNMAAGGQILNISDAVGTLGPDCWDVDPAGNLYFVGTGGLFKLTPGSTTPVNIASDSVRKFFSSINRVTHYVILTWDRDQNGLHIHVTPANTGEATHLFYDATNDAFFPIQYPDSFGPTAAIVYDGDGPNDRNLLIGSRDGYVRQYDAEALDDDGTAINSYVYMGPYRPSGDGALSVLEAVEPILGESPEGFDQDDFGLDLTIQCGTDAYRALNFPERSLTITMDQRVARRKRLLQRLSGGTFFFKVSGKASRLWSLEKLIAVFTQGGLQRRWATNQD